MPDQRPRSVASYFGLHFCLCPCYGSLGTISISKISFVDEAVYNLRKKCQSHTKKLVQNGKDGLS